MHDVPTMTLAVFLLASLLFSICSALNSRPIIGIVAETTKNESRSFIVASYVKYLEGAGARVVPVLGNHTEDQLQHLFSSINGILIPGGAVSLTDSSYSRTGGYLMKLAKQAMDAGDYFPMWGTCLGFQLLCVLEAGTHDIISSFDSENYSISLNLTDDAQGSRLFSGFSSEAFQWIQNEPILMNNHHYGVSPETFADSSKLHSFYKVLGTNNDRQGKQFVSAIEAFNYPIYGVQWHPEKSIYEWTTSEGINHSEHAVIVAETLANFLVQEARKSNHSFSSKDEEDSMLIYNYSPTYTHDSYEQVYYFT